jgi:flagellar motor switch protein FliN/FliY
MGSVEHARALLDQWTESLAQVMESMTDQRPEIHWQYASGRFSEIAADSGDYLWWQQSFHPSPDMLAWVAAPKSTWEFAGTLTLKAAGLEMVEAGEARNTWFEILGQSLSVMARTIGSMVGREVTCDSGAEQAADAAVQDWASVSLTFPDAPLSPLLVTLAPKLLEMIAAPPDAAEAPGQARSGKPSAAEPENLFPAGSRTMELLLDVDLPISISFGKTQLPMKDVLKLTTGSIVELNRGVNDQVEVLVNQCLIARGEVVVVEGNYGVRIQEIASRQERLRSLK